MRKRERERELHRLQVVVICYFTWNQCVYDNSIILYEHKSIVGTISTQLESTEIRPKGEKSFALLLQGIKGK